MMMGAVIRKKKSESDRSFIHNTTIDSEFVAIVKWQDRYDKSHAIISKVAFVRRNFCSTARLHQVTVTSWRTHLK